MQPTEKMYCRSFQCAFRLALPVLPYRDPIILSEFSDIAAVLIQDRLSHPLIVTDRRIRENLLLAPLEKALTKEGLCYTIYDSTLPNPTSMMVEEAANLYRKEKCDTLIAFGGGSPMDCAKAVGARIACPAKKLSQMEGLLKVSGKMPLLIAIPTTAGTGSEATLASVIVDSKTRHKYVINDFHLIPRYCLLSPRVIHTLPFSVTAETGLDALTHAVEAYIGRSTTKETRHYAKTAVNLIFRYLEGCCRHDDERSEKEMLRAAHLAGRAFTRSYVGYVHAISHTLSGKYDLPHGRTNAILLPIVLEKYGKTVHKKLAELAVCVRLGYAEEDEAVLAGRFLEEIKERNRKFGIPSSIPEIREEDIPALARLAAKEANPLYPVPTLFGQKELEEIYRKASKKA